MQRILVRGGKDPFEVVPPGRSLKINTLGTNSGNLVFSLAAHKTLTTSRQRTYSYGFRANPEDAQRINSEYDAFVVPLANAFRPSFEHDLRLFTELIRQLTIPVVVLGVGAQTGLGYDPARLRRMQGTVRDFVGAVLDRSATIGVRGEFTHDYLRSLGFRDVEVIGCPSLFLRGDHLPVARRVPRLSRRSPLAITISPYVEAMAPIIERHQRHYRSLTYVAQDTGTLHLLLRGVSRVPDGEQPGMPVRPDHPLYRQGRIRYFVDPWPWIAFLRGQHFAFGTRIHGTIAALLAGTPAVLLAHDSRTLELARYHEIPHRLLTELPPGVDASDLYDSADFDGFHAGHAERFRRYLDFVELNGLGHVWAPGEDPDAFDRRMDAVPFPAGVTPMALTRPAWSSVAGRVSDGRRLVQRSLARLRPARPAGGQPATPAVTLEPAVAADLTAAAAPAAVDLAAAGSTDLIDV